MINKTVEFTEDGWQTKYTGVIREESLYSYLIESSRYGKLWISKSNVKVLGN